MGRVWLAEHEGLKCEVVVKFILDDVQNRDEVRSRFEREAALLALARSPHVVQVYDYGISLSGHPYIAMEYLEGEDLDSYLRREGRVQKDVFGDWFSQVCVGLGRAHARGTVHRDLKPANLFLAHDDDGIVVKILDFGVARNVFDADEAQSRDASLVLGTMAYMSPEQIRGSRELDARSDLWSLGVLAYRALTGKLPFGGHTVSELDKVIAHGDFVPPSRVNPELPTGLDAWMHRALSKDPAERYPTARGMADALLLVLGSSASTTATSHEPESWDPEPREAMTPHAEPVQMVQSPDPSSELEVSAEPEEPPVWPFWQHILAWIAVLGVAVASYAAARLWFR
jgi:eukaryotic-like serine/threonine-protein kinase